MNERIKQLAIQSKLIAAEPNGFDPTRLSMSQQKFAQLIVEECGVALSPMLRDMVSRGQAFDLIKQHFGVEE
tara:strand:- start:48 stop:263 length:216 start_codon:yes stop_codon:yes gene_type:complete